MSQSVQVVERPILFSGAMVRAILEGRKTQTRRVVAHRITGPNPPKESIFDCYKGKKWVAAFGLDGNGNFLKCCPYGKPRDTLWVRETWQHVTKGMEPTKGCRLLFRADDIAGHIDNGWRPSIHMPRWASRLTLEIVKVRVERLREISEEDAIAEGSQIPCIQLPKSCQQATWTERQQFSRIWDSINAKRDDGKFGWDKNPWVWAITFQRVRS